MRNLLGRVVFLGSLPMVGLGIVMVQSETPVSAVAVSSEYCVADVSPSTGVSVSVAADGDCVVKFTSNSTVTMDTPVGNLDF